MINALGISNLEHELYIHQLETSESFLVQECISKNKLAQKTLYERYYPNLLAVCCRYCENQAEAEDILHDCFIKIFKTIPKFNGQSQLKTWLTRLVINEVLQHLRKKKRLPKVVSIDDNLNEFPELSENELEAYTSKQVFEIIRQLPDGYRQVLCLFSIDGYSHKEIAKALGITDSASRSQLTRARQLLKAKLKNKGGDL